MLSPDTRGKALEMRDSAVDLIPARPSLPKLRDAAANCRACPRWRQRDKESRHKEMEAFVRDLKHVASVL